MTGKMALILFMYCAVGWICYDIWYYRDGRGQLKEQIEIALGGE